jgi:hypothetical protein
MSEASGISEATINIAPKPTETPAQPTTIPNVLETAKAIVEAKTVKTRKEILEEQVSGGRPLTLQEAVKPVGKLPLHHRRAYGSNAQSAWNNQDYGYSESKILKPKQAPLPKPTDITPHIKARNEKSA